MRPGPTILVWLVLLAMGGLEFGLAWVPGARWAVPCIGLSMAALVALTFMRLGVSRGLPRVFAIAGIFWICVMLGLGSLDSFTRHDIPVQAFQQNEGPGRAQGP